MGIGVGIVLLAIGAILTFAADVSVSSISLDAVGVLLMIVGALGPVMTLLVWSAPAGRADRRHRRGAPGLRRPRSEWPA